MKKIILVAISSLVGCVSTTPTIDEYKKELSWASSQVETPTTPDAKQAAIGRFRDFYTDFSVDRINSKVESLYRTDAYFRDGIRSVKGMEALREYFMSSVEGVASCRFDIKDVIEKDGNTYFRWLMKLKLDDDDDELTYVGMSHVIFDTDGMIIFHQDYWDFSELMQEFPVIGRVVSYIKSRL